ncbi:polysaccharide deacetylase family protein [Halocella sp. SP3-1]|uniref:polysaccharide deacetylase family protein n=1 Tax=Halocella sp. SP3-1 TaxID=2382161 RepID=UPI000F75A85E|nr:polysaccharide deacetylase family protein [Halocella sp. SP3-1]AZO95528.1 polysaccharide deacetylase [Halocella sp. SP3-1]
MFKKYIIVICLFLGIISGMASNDLSMPVLSNQETPYYHGRRGKDQISLTINVDWGKEYLPGMIRILHDENVKATFFVTGTWAEKNADLLAEMSRLGHEIGNHGFSHLHPKNLSDSQLIELIKKNEDLIFRITGEKTTLFAPPYGEVDQRISEVASSIGYKTIMWSADTVDWQRPSAEIVYQRAVNKIDDGGIILMHPTEPSLYALGDIIKTLRGRGYKFVTVSELVK